MRAHVKTLLALLLRSAVSVSAQVPSLSPARVSQVAVKTKDLQRATAFYRDTIGLKVLISNQLVSILDCGGMFLLLGPQEPESRVYFEVPDIQKAVETLSNRGVKIEAKPSIVGQLGDVDVWIAAFRDSEDNIMALMSRTPRK
jgi:predicted enzyme related to lactoylglutathione lyase